jgi:hypothetical protein
LTSALVVVAKMLIAGGDVLGSRSRSNGQLVGYSGGLPHKKWLLDMETKNAQVLRAVKNKRRAREQAETTEAKEEEITGDKEEDEEKETKEPTKRAKKDTTTETSA